jgi:hypothetical protein
MVNKVYHASETAITFQESSGDVVITLLNMLAGVGRVSARYDRGAGSQSQLHTVKVIFQSDTTPVAGETVDCYLFQSDGTNEDGNVGTADAAILEPVLKAGMFIGSVPVTVATATVDFIKTFQNVPISERYYSIGIWNATADSLENTANVSKVIVTPNPPEIQ